MMRRVQILAGAHFVFGGESSLSSANVVSSRRPTFDSALSVMYSISVVEIELEVVAISTLLFFVMPLSFTLTSFLLWILYGLQGTLYSFSIEP